MIDEDLEDIANQTRYRKNEIKDSRGRKSLSINKNLTKTRRILNSLKGRKSKRPITLPKIT